MSTGTRVRAGDADRERTVEQLRVAHADGRLDAEELLQRTETAYAARHLDELVPLTADLPQPANAADRAPQPRPHRRRGLPYGPVLVLVVFALLASISAVAHGHPPVPLFWLLVVAMVVTRTRAVGLRR